MRWINFIWALLAISVLSGCAPTQTFQYTPPEGSAALACINSCKVATNSCTQICAMKNRTCRVERDRNATNRYAAYKNQCLVKGVRVKKTYEDYVRTSSCEHSCNCVPSYNTCYRACGGTVY